MLKHAIKSITVLFAIVLVAIAVLAIDPSYGDWSTLPHTRFTRTAPANWNSSQGAITANIKGANLGPEAGGAVLFAYQESYDNIEYVGRITGTKGRELVFAVQSDNDPLAYTNQVLKVSSEGIELYSQDGSEGTLKIVKGRLIFKNEAGRETVIAE